MSEHASNVPVLVVMAAGMGRRFGGLKQLEGVGPSGETLLEYSIYDALRAGFGGVVFIIRRDIEAEFRERVLSRFDRQVACSLVYQELDCLPDGYMPPPDRSKPWGTGHAVLMARKNVSGSFVVINADDFYGAHAYASMANFFTTRTESHHYAMAGYRLRNTLSAYGAVSRGICHSDSQRQWLRHVEEVRGIAADARGEIRGEGQTFSGEELASMNFWGFTPGFFDLLESDFEQFLKKGVRETDSEFYLPATVSDAIANGVARVEILPVEDKWYGVTYREDQPEVAAAIREYVAQGVYPERLWQ